MTSQSTLEERFGKCPYATAQSIISGKWAVLILLYLEDGPIRFNELLRRMPKMTHATLSVQLKSLEEYGLVRRVQYEAIPAEGGVFPHRHREEVSPRHRRDGSLGKRIYRSNGRRK